MSKGQQAMAVAMMSPEPAKTKRKRSGSLKPKELGISGARIYSAASARRVVDLHKPGHLGGIGIRLGPGSSAKLDFCQIVFHPSPWWDDRTTPARAEEFDEYRASSYFTQRLGARMPDK